MLYLPHGSGQSLVEYALILVLVAIAAIVILFLFGSAIGNLYSNTMANL
jgi:Flp pilus assembly pilin Flp